MTVQPGWYADPAEPTTQRWWDGEGWVGEPLPVDATPPPGPPPPPPAADAPDTDAAGAAGAAGDGQPGGAGAAETRETGDRQPAAASVPPPAPPTPPAPPAGTPHPPAAPTAPHSPAGPPYAPAGPHSPGGPYPPAAPHSPGGPSYPFGGPYPQPAPAPPPYPPGAPYPPYGFPLPPGFPAPPPRPHGHPLAAFGPRLAARMIDIGVVLLLNAVVNGWFVWQYVQEVGPVLREILRRSMAGNSSTEGLPQISGQADGLQVTILLIAAALWFAYEVPATANGGQTFGKRLMGVKVVPLAADEPLGFGRSLRRWNLLGLPTFLWCCGVGFVLQFVDCVFPLFDRPLRQALHDKRAQTVVVRAPAPQAATAGPPSRPDEPDRSGDRS